MFCPTCGREDAQERKFCPSCGTNLDRVTKALTPGKDNFFVQADAAFDRVLGRYAGMFFKDAPKKAQDRSVSNSWQIFGLALLSLLANFILLPVGFVALKLRFFTLLLATPFRLLSERSDQQAKESALRANNQEQWLLNAVPGVTEHTTINLASRPGSERRKT